MASTLRTIRIGLWTFAAAGVLAAAAFSPWTPELGRQELQTSPIWLGLSIAFAFLLSEFIARGGRAAAASVATAALAIAVGIGLSRLALAFFMPESDRDFSTWHLVPLFAVLHVAIVSGPLYAVGAFLRIFVGPRADGRG